MCAGICCIYIYIYLQYHNVTIWFTILCITCNLFVYLYIHNIYVYVYWMGSGEYPFYQLQVELFSPRSTRNVPGILLVDAEHWISGWNLWGSSDSLQDIGDVCWDRVINRNSICLGMCGWFRVIFVWEVHGLQLFFWKCVARYLAR